MTIKTLIEHIPVIDLRGMKDNLEATANEVLAASRDIGFLFVKIPPEQRQHLAIFELAKEFFDSTPEKKMEYRIDMKTNFGYSAMRHEKVDPEHTKKGDFKESYNIGRLVNGEPLQELPPSFSQNLDKLREFQNLCNETACNIMECLAIGLKIPEDKGGRKYFASKYLEDTTPNDVIRILHYPSVDALEPDAKVEEEIRIGRHSDYGLITLLWQRRVGGLQVQSNQENEDAEKMTWLDVPVLEDCIVVNMGDCLQHWTNGYIRSTKHRVIFKPETLQQTRYSMAYFVQGGQIPLDPIPSELIAKESKPIAFKTSAEYLKHRLSLTYNNDGY